MTFADEISARNASKKVHRILAQKVSVNVILKYDLMLC